MGLIMLFTFSHDANSCEIYNRENISIKGYEGRTRWGDYQINLEASRLGWSLRVVKWYLKRIGIKNADTVDKVVKAVKHVLITHEHLSMELGWKNPFEPHAHIIDSYIK